MLNMFNTILFNFCTMPRIVNGQIVNDDAPRREPEKNRIRTWNDIQSGRASTQGEVHTLRNRASTEKKPEAKEEELAFAPPASIPQYLIHALGFENYNISIPPSNPVITINAVFFIIFIFFTLIFGYKMAV